MKPKHSLILGLLALLLGLLLRPTATAAHTPWLGPAGTRWAGTELRGMQRWGGYFGNVGIRGEYLELRCRRFPFLKTRSGDYWPGAEWHGWAEWKADKVTYQTGWKKATPKIQPVSFSAPWWLRFCA